MKPTTSLLESRAAAYLAKLPHAVTGAGGHAATFSAACRLVEFGLSFEQAAPLLAAWNETHCQPKWTPADLHHKLADAFKRTTAKPEFVTGRRNVFPRSVTTPAAPPVTVRPPANAARSQARVTDQADAAQLATTIRTLLDQDKVSRPAPASESPLAAAIEAVAKQLERIGEQRNMAALARLRGLDSFALHETWRRGLLRFGNHFGKPAWFVLDRSLRNACARRMDGLPWHHGAPSECKAMILRGAQAKWPIGIREAQDYPKIILCEGAPDFLTAFHFIAKLGRSAEFAPVAMLSGSYPIHTDALRLFTGKRVRIYAHNDGGTGANAAARWTEQIKHRATVDVFSFARYGVKDLNDFARGNFPTENFLP